VEAEQGAQNGAGGSVRCPTCGEVVCSDHHCVPVVEDPGRLCAACGKPTRRRPQARFCEDCAYKRHRGQKAEGKRKRRLKFRVPSLCHECGSKFERKSPSQRYCAGCGPKVKVRHQRTINGTATRVGQIRRSPIPRAMVDLSVTVMLDEGRDCAPSMHELERRFQVMTEAQRAHEAGELGGLWDFRAQLLELASECVRLVAAMPVPENGNGNVPGQAAALRNLPALMLPAA
jgi:hypothetical protein